MFIRRVKKQRSKDSKVFYQYTLAQSARIDGKPRQFALLHLGSDPLLADKENRAAVLSILKSKIWGQPALFPEPVDPSVKALGLSLYKKYEIKYGIDGQVAPTTMPPKPEKADYEQVDISSLEVTDSRSFGGEHLCKQTLEKLELGACLTKIGFSETEVSKALISISSRALFASSEHKTAQILSMNSELQQCYKYDATITHKQLYSIADKLYEHKSQIDKHLYDRACNLFGLDDKLVIFDISNTYFETSKKSSKLAAYGRSKEKRSDCPLVVFSGVINAEGFIRHSRIYQGNMSDTATLSDMLKDLEAYSSSKQQKTVVIDAGIASQENLDLISSKGYNYVCVSRQRLKDYPVDITTKPVTVYSKKGKNKLELVTFQPAEYEDQWMYVKSEAKRTKEQSMVKKLEGRYIELLTTIQKAIDKKGGTKKIEKVWERIGRAKERHKRVSSRFAITVKEKEGIATSIEWKRSDDKSRDDKSNGIYFLRTNIKDPDSKQLWDIYNTIREVESTFRCLKSDLQIRPVFHQNDGRIKSHIYLTIVAYQLVNTIRHMLKNQNLNYDWKNILRIMSTQTIQTVKLPTPTKDVHLRIPTKPIHEVQEIYRATQCANTQKPTKKYVVYH